MNQTHGRPGKFYYSIKCGNIDCQEPIPLAEVPPSVSVEVDEAVRSGLKVLAVRCPACSQPTVIGGQDIFVAGTH
jgi:hypothetical protein